MSRLLTTPELAKLWGVSTDKILQFVEQGELRGIDFVQDKDAEPEPGKKRRRRWRFHPDDIEDFLNRRATSLNGRTKKKKRTTRPPVRDIQFR